jgi:hypothetical protein
MDFNGSEDMPRKAIPVAQHLASGNKAKLAKTEIEQRLENKVKIIQVNHIPKGA